MQSEPKQAKGREPYAEPPTDSAEIAALRAIVEGTAHTTGQEFFQSLVRQLASAVQVSHAFVAEFAGVNTRARTLAYWAGDHIADNVEWDLAGTPCEDVLRGSLCHHPADVYRKFPGDKALVMPYVLNDFAKAEQPWVEDMASACADFAELLAKGEDASFQNKVHLAMDAKGFGPDVDSDGD